MKRYYCIDSPEGPKSTFKRHAYQLIDDPLVTLVHYLGDENMVIHFPHRSSKEELQTPFIRTAPSYLNSLREKVQGQQPSRIYKEEVATVLSRVGPEYVPTAAPRNMKQLRNLRHHSLQNFRLSSDDIFNVHQIAYDLNGFVTRIQTYPDLEVVFGLSEITSELDNMLAIGDSGQLLSYDTTFNLGDFYLSALIFRHTAFKGNPCIPGVFLLHERKFTSTHQNFFRTLKAMVPSLNRSQSPIVTDQEKAIINAIAAEVPQMPHVYCWNHVLQDMCRWLREHGAPSEDVTVYMEHVRQLLHQPSKEAYHTLLRKHQMSWDETFNAYYTNSIHKVIAERLGRWQLEKLDTYNPYSGVTTNQSEAFNRVVKDLQQWKEAPVDVMILSLFQLQTYLHNEIQRGMCGLGEYRLKSNYRSLLKEPGEVDLLKCEKPANIVALLQPNKKMAIDGR